jgi:DNA polymerase III delta prime subunit
MKELWVEKYRPKTVAGYVFRDEAHRRQINGFINEGSIPHLLLSGAPGIGKTTLAKILLNEIGISDYDVLEVNASRETGIDFIRDKIIPFISMIPFGPFKVVLLDEADRLSQQAQDSLKGIIEEYSAHARFILTCNTPSRIHPPLHSRCQHIHFNNIDKTEFTARAATILIEEGIKFDLDMLDTYVVTVFPDLRKCINLLQQNSIDGVLVDPRLEDSGVSDYKIEMVELFKKRKIKEARTLLCAKARPDEMESIFRWLYDNLNLFGHDEETKDSALLIIKQGLVDNALIADPEINLSATLIKLARLQPQ